MFVMAGLFALSCLTTIVCMYVWRPGAIAGVVLTYFAVWTLLVHGQGYPSRLPVPDGQVIVTALGDYVWTMPVDGGEPRTWLDPRTAEKTIEAQAKYGAGAGFELRPDGSDGTPADGERDLMPYEPKGMVKP